MKKTYRMFALALATVLLLSALAGCSAPRLTIGGTPKTAGTVDGQSIPTGEFLAYMYNNFYSLYVNGGLYYYASAGYDVWEQTYPYGEGDDQKELKLDEYVRETTKDLIVRQAALKRLIDDNGLEMDKTTEEEFNTSISQMKEGAYLTLGISDENFINATRKVTLYEVSAFNGLYGESGKTPVSETEIKQYFDNNYLSYKIITKSLVDENGTALDDAGKATEKAKMEEYLKQYTSSKNFETVVDAYNKANATDDSTETTASTDADNRKDVDANDIDENLAKAIREVPVGQAKVVEYSSDGTTATVALILRLDPNSGDLYTNSKDTIRHSMKDEEFDTKVDEYIGKVEYSFNKSTVNKCNPKDFVSEDE